ncbi:ABC transporter ATP-binding protein [Natronospora cellulosivora (SeqCode)]
MSEKKCEHPENYMKIIEVINLSKKYGEFTAVDKINFQIDKGEIFGFLGPNGAGKTTTINILTGLAKITSGEVKINKIDCKKDIRKAQKYIGVVASESNLYPELNGFENLSFAASLYGLRKAEREKRARDLLEKFDLLKFGRLPFSAYSKGMKRKLTIAAGIIHKPDILFLDEPTTGIDVASARQIRKLILDLNSNGTTIFLTTHYIEEAERLCDRIAFIVAGKIKHIDHTEILINNAQKDNIIEFTVNRTRELEKKIIKDAIINKLANYKVSFLENKIRIHTPGISKLKVFIDIFNDLKFEVYEAKLIKPSLEDIFVDITGIGLAEMKNESSKKGGKVG